MREGSGHLSAVAEKLKLAGALFAVVAALLLLAAGQALAAPPEAYGPLAVHETAVQIPVPLDPSAPEGVFPYVNADVYVPAAPGRGRWCSSRTRGRGR